MQEKEDMQKRFGADELQRLSLLVDEILNTKNKPLEIGFTLKEKSPEEGKPNRTLEGHVAIWPCDVGIVVKGYAPMDVIGGEIVVIELNNDSLQAVAWLNHGNEEPCIIDLEEAKEGGPNEHV